MLFLLHFACMRNQLPVTVHSSTSDSTHFSADHQVEQWLLEPKPSSINADREANLLDLAAWIQERITAGLSADLIFVCTHNSRRSHISQLWTQAAAAHLELGTVMTYSGGTEATAFNPRAIKALQSHGFVIEASDLVLGEQNTVYNTVFSSEAKSIQSFSKRYDHEANPSADFAAVMVCGTADRSCPVVKGAETRISIPYIDPKLSDGTPQEEAIYLAKSEEIGREMVWMLKQVSLER
ncbi:MAG: protein-tyrosine-phosphatase [Myxococcota bacterium]|nr:protein-tyrosine-phosphatase [Myxococcota bacterium]